MAAPMLKANLPVYCVVVNIPDFVIPTHSHCYDVSFEQAKFFCKFLYSHTIVLRSITAEKESNQFSDKKIASPLLLMLN